MQLGYLPASASSAGKIGPIYIPAINWLMAICVAAVVLGSGSTSRLAAAYGIAVTGTMAVPARQGDAPGSAAGAAGIGSAGPRARPFI